MNSNTKKWKQLLKDRKAWCYIKPNRYVHESGWRCFEVGYLTIKKDDNKMEEKLVLSKYSDDFWHREDILTNTPPAQFHMDITRDGYMRIHSRKILTWENRYDWVVSSFSLEEMK